MKKSIVCVVVCMICSGMVACGGGSSDSAPATSNTKWVLSTLEYDNNVDGFYEKIGYVTNDSKGYRIKLEIDEQRDGTINAIATYLNDAQGHMIQYSWDNNTDGVVDSKCTMSNDTYGNETYVECDINMDGQIDYTEIFANTYDSNNRITKTVATAFTYYYEYDTNGNTSYTRLDDSNDGIINSNMKSTWTQVVVSAAAMLDNKYGNEAVEVAGQRSEKAANHMGGMPQEFQFIDQYGTH